MSTESFKVGEQVEVTSGAFAGARGAVADLREFDSVMRIETKDGNAYSMIDTAKKVNAVAATPSNRPLKKR